MPNEFVFPVQVYIEDTDMGGVVYHANYLKYMERARTAWCSALGIRLEQLARAGIHFVVRQALVDYLAPARWNDALQVVSRVLQWGHTYVVYDQRIQQQDADEGVYCQGRIQVVCINQQYKPRRIPPQFVEGLSSGR